MIVASKPPGEAARLKSLLDLALLDTDPEPAFDAIVQCAATAAGAPVALVSLIDADRQWFKARIGLDVRETHRDLAFCSHAILDDRSLVVQDASSDPRFYDNPLVTGAPHVAAYLGTPLLAPDGHRIGTLCAIDHQPHPWSEREIAELEGLSRLTTEILRMRAAAKSANQLALQVADLSRDLFAANTLMEEVSQIAGVGGWQYVVGSEAPVWTAETRRIHEVPDDFTPTLESAIEFYAPEAQDTLREWLARAMQTGEPYAIDLPFITAKGNPVWVRAAGKPIFADGVVTRLVGTFQNITEQRAWEDELTAARAKAEAATKSKSAFLANMSHEIRTPLNGVTGLAGALAGTELTPKQREMVELIRASGDTLDRLLSDILDASKIEAGKLVLLSHPFDLQVAVRQAGQVMEARADDKGLDFRISFSERARGTFLGDVVRIRQIVSNLTSNAVKFTERGVVTVSVDVEEPLHDLTQIVLSVEDTGIGFDEEASERLFNRFSQGEHSISHAHKGTGLGLSICKELCELMGGGITASSAPGAGSRFVVTLPLPRAVPLSVYDATHARPAEAEPAETLIAETNGARLRVLLAEDNHTNQRVASLILESFGADVTIVNDGLEALEAFEIGRFDLVLMDMNMPRMDGPTAVREIRIREAEAGAERMPIAMLSAYAMSEHREMSYQAGADVHITKPITPRSLRDGIESAMQAASEWTVEPRTAA